MVTKKRTLGGRRKGVGGGEWSDSMVLACLRNSWVKYASTNECKKGAR